MDAARPPRLTNYFLYLLFIATIGPLLFGYHLAELNAPQDVLTCLRKGITLSKESALPECISMTTSEFSLVSSIFTLGGLVGALSAGSPSTKYGRLRVMRYTTLAFTVGPIAEAGAPNIGILALGRFVSGLGAGAAVVVVPIYVSEISPPGRKGFFGSFTQVMVNFGILLTQFLGYFLSRPQLWRAILGIGGIIGVSQFLGLFFVMESPKWQADQGLVVEAKLSLQSIRGQGNSISRELTAWGVGTSDAEHCEHGHFDESAYQKTSNSCSFLDEESEGLMDNSREVAPNRPRIDTGHGIASKKESVGILGVVVNPQHRGAVLLVMLVMLSQQFTGINSIMMYGVSLLADLLEQSSALLNVCVAAMNLIVSAACVPLPDRFGRKPCLLASICGMGVCSLVLAVAIMNSIRLLAAIAVLAFVASFCLGLGPVPFILASELVGPEAVGATQSWALAANWTSTFVVAQFFPMLNQALGKGKIFLVFAFLAVGFAALVGVYLPETKIARPSDEERPVL